MKKKLLSIIFSIIAICQSSNSLFAMNINLSLSNDWNQIDTSSEEEEPSEDSLEEEIYDNYHRLQYKVCNFYNNNKKLTMRLVNSFLATSDSLEEFTRRMVCFNFIICGYAFDLSINCPEYINTIEYIEQNIPGLMNYKSELLFNFLHYCDTVHVSDNSNATSLKFPNFSYIDREMIEDLTKHNCQINTLYKILLEISDLFKKDREVVIQKIREFSKSKIVNDGLSGMILGEFIVPAYSLGGEQEDLLIGLFFNRKIIINTVEQLNKLDFETLQQTILNMNDLLISIKDVVEPTNNFCDKF